MNEKAIHINQLVSALRSVGDIILLESQKEDHSASERSYLAAMPKKSIFGQGNNIYRCDESHIKHFENDPWEAIKDFREEVNDWVFGYFGYDLKNNIEDLSSFNATCNSLPDFYFMVPDLLIEFNLSGEYKIIKGELPKYNPNFRNEKPDDYPKVTNEVSIDKRDYLANVILAKELIHEGEIYEINYSYLRSFNFIGSGWKLYQKMKEAGPVPFGSFLKINDIEVCCASPERFLKREENNVFSQPIKGTISNTKDSQLADLNSEKNRAENLMIVDLVRNDMNRVAIPGTVEVKNLFEVQTFDTVHQLVSTIVCQVEDQTDSIEIIKACFPMGSMTGAPKIAAMRSIENLESYKRGIYSGAIGYIKPNGDFDLNVVIRTAILEGGKLMYPVGGAITSDSIPEDEWEETQVKTQALKKALK